ncbi:nucleotide-binding domain-containing protein [Pseudarthrobacter sp. 1C304]|uniref:nucleotide-binding domain-containing protein n=1 Tax=Pseudarthrobacter sp. 1C304 TaxID=3457438 RepID=UPI003FD38BA9
MGRRDQAKASALSNEARKLRLAHLDARVGSINEALKGSSDMDGRLLDTVPQGSWAHRTIIRPPDNIEFDADFLVQLAEDTDGNDNPRSYANAVWSAISSHSIYGPMATKKNRCVRVSYANDWHIDIVTYVVLASGRQAIVNRKSNEFEDANPVGFTEWIQEKDDLTNGNLRKVLRLLKYLRDHQEAFSIKSVLLTTIVGNLVDAWRVYGTDKYKDVPSTLVNLVEDLDRWLQSQWSKPSIADPSCPATTFDHRWTESQFEAFRTKIHNLVPRIREAYDASTVSESVSGWRAVFGPAFPDSLLGLVASSTATVLTKNEPRIDRAPNEQFIEDMFPVNESYRLSMVCEVSPPQQLNRAARRALRATGGRVPKEHSLRFKITETTVPGPYHVFWKVRNHGAEATARGSLRGEITKDAGQQERTESTLYAGNHYVDCYIVKDGVCVARTREPVLIA